MCYLLLTWMGSINNYIWRYVLNLSTIFWGFTEPGSQPEALNEKAVKIVQRVRDKLTGRDFSKEESVDVKTQVDLLIQQATSHENLCQCYIGWCPFW